MNVPLPNLSGPGSPTVFLQSPNWRLASDLQQCAFTLLSSVLSS